MEAQNDEISYFNTAWSWIAASGWYVLGLAILLMYFSPQIKNIYINWKRRKDETEYAAKYHKNPDLFQARLAGIEAARQRMQEKYLQDVEKARQLEEERLEKKKQEFLKLTEKQYGGDKLGQSDGGASTSKQTKSSSLKTEYNPLMGDSSRGYRAPKRRCCSKGGCS